jgi:predicted transcriptional regulator
LLNSDPSRFHVTVSEGAEEGCAAFFESVGFRRIAVQSNRYRAGVDEFIYSCSKEQIEDAIRGELAQGIERTLFGVVPRSMPKEHTLLMSLRPEFAELVLQGRKTIEFRRRFSRKYEGATIVFYITRPVKQFMFTATVAQVDHRQTDQLWSVYQGDGGVSREVFDQYFSGVSYGYAIHLSNVRQIPAQLNLEQAQEVSPTLRAPQSFQRLEPRSPLVRALQLQVNV